MDKIIVYGKYITEKNLLGDDLAIMATTDYHFAKRMFAKNAEFLKRIRITEREYYKTGKLSAIIGNYNKALSIKKVKANGLEVIYSGRHLTKEICMENIHFDVAKYFDDGSLFDIRKFRGVKDLDGNSNHLKFLLNDYYIPQLYAAENDEIKYMSICFTMKDFAKGSCIEQQLNDFVDFFPKIINKPSSVDSYADAIITMYQAMQAEEYMAVAEYRDLLANVEDILL